MEMESNKADAVRIQTSILNASEKKLLVWLAKRQPGWMTSDILTYIGTFGAAVIAVGYILSARNIGFLWLSSLGFVINWYGDSLDGTLARVRNTQRPIYGYYIDHTHASENDGEKVIYLTFDAGYENGNVAGILDVLKEERVPAAFFILGHLIEHDTALVKRMAEEGHLVCNHTVSHKDMSLCDDAAFLEELQALEKLYEEKTGYRMASYYRPPEGKFSRENLACAQKNQYKTIFCVFCIPRTSGFWQFHPPGATKKKQVSCGIISSALQIIAS